ncbi:hypothetical protein BCR32DRAFT_329737 [Anaeromyces robustus]|uniref:Uncharacterized protein n=1 Tax=Anaeromyces robustus TaxID=1754192 RepID=A0A1Y1WPY9_9FUNG|nr:hypothetical protein BCR32DRAFT_329737 [Anaeromyces robustus]|eukprot:ORX75590.1 hypothetical protein BCR32DRAFT_329737 [Anaeromyces robustus]
MIQPNENNVGNNKNIKNRNNHRYDNNDEDGSKNLYERYLELIQWLASTNMDYL